MAGGRFRRAASTSRLQAIAAPRDYTQIAEIVRERLRPLNINVTVEPLEIGTFADEHRRRRLPVGLDRPRHARRSERLRRRLPLRHRQQRDGSATAGRTRRSTRLYDEALATADQAQRLEAYQRIQQIIAEDVPNLYTVQPHKFQVANQRVEGMYVSYTDFNTGLRTACVTEE